MNTESLSNETIGRYIPNILAETQGETPLAEKLVPFITSAKVWLETEYLGPDDFLSDVHNDLALKILVYKAFADAVPALDLVVTPAGMAVINTDNMAPASKERVERLIASLHERTRKLIPSLLAFCRTYEVWRMSERGRYFGATFINSPEIYDGISALENISYNDVRSRAFIVECELADRYLGRQLMDTLRNDFNAGVIKRGHPLVGIILSSIVSLITPSASGVMIDQNRLWHAVRPIINELKYHNEYNQLWESEMGDKFNAKGFVNNIKGGFYF